MNVAQAFGGLILTYMYTTHDFLESRLSDLLLSFICHDHLNDTVEYGVHW